MPPTAQEVAQAKGELAGIKSMLPEKIAEQKRLQMSGQDTSGDAQRRIGYDIQQLQRRQMELEGIVGQAPPPPPPPPAQQRTRVIEPDVIQPPPAGFGVRTTPQGKKVRVVPRYVVRVSSAWRNAQIAKGLDPETQIRLSVPSGANFTVQNI